tara:strand:- start:1474 stop:1863 length:390 start_codon:yes stop_codon:yes gene_type:complete
MARFCCGEKRRFRQTGFRRDGSAKGYCDICVKCNGVKTKISKRKNSKISNRKLPTCKLCFANDKIKIRTKGHKCKYKISPEKKRMRSDDSDNTDDELFYENLYNKYFASDTENDVENEAKNDVDSDSDI